MIESTSVDELIERLRLEIQGLKQPCKQEVEIWTRAQTAAFFQVSFRKLQKLKTHKMLIPINIGKREFYKKSDIDALVIRIREKA